jgi:hypothetical protein
VRFFRLAPNTTTCIAVLPSPRPGLPAAVVITVRGARGQRCPDFGVRLRGFLTDARIAPSPRPSRKRAEPLGRRKVDGYVAVD